MACAASITGNLDLASLPLTRAVRYWLLRMASSSRPGDRARGGIGDKGPQRGHAPGGYA
jgi:hypothetical protein